MDWRTDLQAQKKKNHVCGLKAFVPLESLWPLVWAVVMLIFVTSLVEAVYHLAFVLYIVVLLFQLLLLSSSKDMYSCGLKYWLLR